MLVTASRVGGGEVGAIWIPQTPFQAHGRAGDHALAYRSLDRSLFQGPHIAAPNGGDWVPREEWHAPKRGREQIMRFPHIAHCHTIFFA